MINKNFHSGKPQSFLIFDIFWKIDRLFQVMTLHVKLNCLIHNILLILVAI